MIPWSTYLLVILMLSLISFVSFVSLMCTFELYQNLFYFNQSSHALAHAHTLSNKLCIHLKATIRSHTLNPQPQTHTRLN